MRWETASAEIDVQSDILLHVSVTPEHSQPISEWLHASKYSRCITDLLFTLYRNPASQPHKHHNIPRNVFILIIRSAKCKCFLHHLMYFPMNLFIKQELEYKLQKVLTWINIL